MSEKTSGWPVPGGSGPVPGVIGVTEETSVQALCNYYPIGGVEFVYDPIARRLAAGRPQSGQFDDSPHQQLAQSIDAVHSKVLGGTLQRGESAEFFTSEQSGHYGQNWNDFYRETFPNWLAEITGLPTKHHSWEEK
jgi:filamentous hemagglutinin